MSDGPALATAEPAVLSEDQARALFDAALAPFEAAGEALSARERDVLYHRVVVQLDNAGIATVLLISPKTVQVHVTNIGAKLRFVGRQRALERALVLAYSRRAAVAE